MTQIPDWAKREENYEPLRDRDNFISRSLLHIMGALFAVRAQAGRDCSGVVSPVAALLCAAVLTFLCAAANTTAFLLCLAAALLVVLCFSDARQILRILRRALGAAFFSLLLVLPAVVFFGAAKSLLIPLKTFLTMGILCLLTEFFPWHGLTAALRFFRVPTMFVFILDTALRFIALLGRFAAELLTALSLRSVGKNAQKGQAVAFVLGVTFLKSQEMAEEMHTAMCCRGFTGEYYAAGGNLRALDAALFAAMALFAVLFCTTEGLWR